MIVFAIALLSVGGLVALIAAVWTLALAFQRHVLWGLAVLLIPFANFAFLFARWREARAPFVLGLSSLLLMGSAYYAMPEGSISTPTRAVMSAFKIDRAMQSQIAEQEMKAAREQAEVQLRLVKLKKKEAALLQRKSALQAGDAAGAAALTGEIKQYNAELRPLLEQRPAMELASK